VWWQNQPEPALTAATARKMSLFFFHTKPSAYDPEFELHAVCRSVKDGRSIDPHRHPIFHANICRVHDENVTYPRLLVDEAPLQVVVSEGVGDPLMMNSALFRPVA